MKRTMTAMAAAAAAAALAAGPLMANEDTTAALWQDAAILTTDATLQTGALHARSANSGFTAGYYEIDGHDERTWFSTVTADLAGVDSAILEMRYAWAARSNNPYILIFPCSTVRFNWDNLVSYISFDGGDESRAIGRAGDESGVSGRALLLRTDAVRPPGTEGLPVVEFSSDTFSVTTRLRMENLTPGTVAGGCFYLQDGLASKGQGYGLTATVTQLQADGVSAGWSGQAQADLTTVRNMSLTRSSLNPLPAESGTDGYLDDSVSGGAVRKTEATDGPTVDSTNEHEQRIPVPPSDKPIVSGEASPDSTPPVEDPTLRPDNPPTESPATEPDYSSPEGPAAKPSPAPEVKPTPEPAPDAGPEPEDEAGAADDVRYSITNLPAMDFPPVAEDAADEADPEDEAKLEDEPEDSSEGHVADEFEDEDEDEDEGTS